MPQHPAWDCCSISFMVTLARQLQVCLARNARNRPVVGYSHWKFQPAKSLVADGCFIYRYCLSTAGTQAAVCRPACWGKTCRLLYTCCHCVTISQITIESSASGRLQSCVCIAGGERHVRGHHRQDRRQVAAVHGVPDLPHPPDLCGRGGGRGPAGPRCSPSRVVRLFLASTGAPATCIVLSPVCGRTHGI